VEIPNQKTPLIIQFSPASCYFHLPPNIYFSTLFLNTLRACSSFSEEDQVSHPQKTKTKASVPYQNPIMDNQR
jgi:hypothetical protein